MVRPDSAYMSKINPELLPECSWLLEPCDVGVTGAHPLSHGRDMFVSLGVDRMPSTVCCAVGC